MPLLSLSRVSFDYGRERILRSVSLDLDEGEKAALVGVNGSGKSTLLRLLAGDVEPDTGERHVARRARVAVLPQETAAEGDGTLLEWVSRASDELDAVRTELEALQARLEAGEVLEGEALDHYGELQHRFEALGGYAHAATIEAVLLGLGFSRDDLAKPLRVLSGGERRRAALAAVLTQGADVVLLDEPTNHLDLDALEWLQEHVARSPSAMLVVSHDRYFLDHTVTSVWHLSMGNLMRWKGNYTQFRDAYEEWIATEETAYNRQQHEIRKTEEFIRRNIAGQKTKQAKGRRKQLARLERIEKPREERTSFKLRLVPRTRGGNVVLAARGLTKRFGARTLFADLDIDLRRGDKVGIVGPNGAGKTTLLKILAGRLAPDAGSVRLGTNIDMGYFDQELDFVGDAPSLMEEIWRVDRSMKEEEIRTVLGAFGFGEDYVDRAVRVLSGGQRSRLGLLKMVLEQHNFLVLDEPTNHLDLDSVAVLEQGLRDFEGTLLLVSHDRTLLSRAINTLLILTGGRARLFHGGYEEYVQSLGGKPLWSAIEEHEARRAGGNGDGGSGRRGGRGRGGGTTTREAGPARGTDAERGAAARATGRAHGEAAGDSARAGTAAAPAWSNTSSGTGRKPSAAEEAGAQSADDGKPVSKNALSRLKKQLDALEDEIVTLEVDVEEIEEGLGRAHTLPAADIEALSRRHGERKQALQAAMARWERLSEEYESKKRRFDAERRKKK